MRPFFMNDLTGIIQIQYIPTHVFLSTDKYIFMWMNIDKNSRSNACTAK